VGEQGKRNQINSSSWSGGVGGFLWFDVAGASDKCWRVIYAKEDGESIGNLRGAVEVEWGVLEWEEYWSGRIAWVASSDSV
jgi:hypothetical protein